MHACPQHVPCATARTLSTVSSCFCASGRSLPLASLAPHSVTISHTTCSGGGRGIPSVLAVRACVWRGSITSSADGVLNMLAICACPLITNHDARCTPRHTCTHSTTIRARRWPIPIAPQPPNPLCKSRCLSQLPSAFAPGRPPCTAPRLGSGLAHGKHRKAGHALRRPMRTHACTHLDAVLRRHCRLAGLAPRGLGRGQQVIQAPHNDHVLHRSKPSKHREGDGSAAHCMRTGRSRCRKKVRVLERGGVLISSGSSSQTCHSQTGSATIAVRVLQVHGTATYKEGRW